MSRLALLKEVDAEVRDQIRYGKDELVLGFSDDWKLPERTETEGIGDCEDFAMLAAEKLLARGVPKEEMYFVLAHTAGAKGFNHCFLMVETPEGLHTCADTMAGQSLPYTSTYRIHELRQWAQLSEPKRWRVWQGD